jgi:hypothetical protein
MERIVLVFNPNDKTQYFCGVKDFIDEVPDKFEVNFYFVDGDKINFGIMFENNNYKITSVYDDLIGINYFEDYKNWKVKVI